MMPKSPARDKVENRTKLVVHVCFFVNFFVASSEVIPKPGHTSELPGELSFPSPSSLPFCFLLFGFVFKIKMFRSCPPDDSNAVCLGESKELRFLKCSR